MKASTMAVLVWVSKPTLTKACMYIGCTSLGEQVARMSEAIDQTAPMPTNTTDRIDKIETEIKYFESKFMDKILTVVNDMNNLKTTV